MAKYPTFHWLILFIDIPRVHWIDKLLPTKKGFRHVALLGFGPNAPGWVFMDWRGDRCDIHAFTDEQVSRVYDFVSVQSGTVVGYWPANEKGVKFRPRIFPFWTCVQAVKHVLGIRARWVFTPQALHRWLLRHGAFEISVRRREGNGENDGSETTDDERRGSGCEGPGGQAVGGSGGQREEEKG